jgi:hypothetical protein
VVATERLSPLGVLAWLVPALLLAAALYDLAAATQLIDPVGDQPGDGPPGAGAATLIALVGLVLALGGSVRGALARRPPRLLALFAPAAAALLVAHGLQFDPYDAPSLVRFSDGWTSGNIEWVAGLAAASVLAGAVTWRWPRLGAGLTTLVLLPVALSWLFVGVGH